MATKTVNKTSKPKYETFECVYTSGLLIEPSFLTALSLIFDKIYILDLHGNSIRKEKALDGSKDENVFDIQQGVSIIFLIKNKKGTNNSVYHQELFGQASATHQRRPPRPRQFCESVFRSDSR